MNSRFYEWHILWLIPDRPFVLTSTLDHPFWIEGMGWTAAIARWKTELEEGRLRLMDRSTVLVHGHGRVFSTDQPGIGWFSGAGRYKKGVLWNYEASKLVQAGVHYDWHNWVDGDVYGEDEHLDLYMRTTVYKIEVEDFHTYFVGKHGVWVHD